MKRIAARVIVFLLLGAIVNVAVAWGCAIAIDVRKATNYDLQSGYEAATVVDSRAFHRIGASQYVTTRSRLPNSPNVKTTGIKPRECPWTDAFAPTGEFSRSNLFAEMRCVDGRGWPMLALWCEMRQQLVAGKAPSAELKRAIELALTPWEAGPPPLPRFIPLQPIWPGFAINTIFYAAVLWMMFFAPFAPRRRRRINRGLCPACAYPIGSSPVCTECGKAVQTRNAETQKAEML